MPYTRIFAAALGVALCGPALAADTERLTPATWVQIKTAYTTVLADPSHDPDRLSPSTYLDIQAAFDAPLAGPSVDELSPYDLALIQRAYTSHDPDWVELAARAAE